MTDIVRKILELEDLMLGVTGPPVQRVVEITTELIQRKLAITT